MSELRSAHALRASRLAISVVTLATLLVGCGGAPRTPPPFRALRSPRSVALLAPLPPVASSDGPVGIVGDYEVVWDPDAGSLKVAARFTASAGSTFRIERDVEPYVEAIEMSADRDGASWMPVARRDAHVTASACAAGPCRLRYRVALREAAKRLDDLDTASEEGEVVEAPPSTWLIAPVHAPRAMRLRFRVTCPESARFVTGVFHSAEAPDAWDISIDDLWTSPYTAFGPLRVRTIPVQGGTLELAIGPGKLAVTDDELAAWTEASARAVSTYYGRFPMRSALVLLMVSRGRWVGSGRSLSGGGGTVLVRIGEGAPPQAYRDDWVLVHEMIHLTFPTVPREHEWAEEGIATYAEPFARARAGLMTSENAWVGLVQGLPNGLPTSNDRGLDYTPTWGRIYWGGALFWFLADVEIRKRTQNRVGLEHALRGILEAGGNNATRWALDDALDAGDRATGVPVLRALHATMGSLPHPVDLGALLKSLGVELSRGHVHFDEKAPLADIRRGITRGTDAK